MNKKDRQLYRALVKLNVGRENALNLILVRMGLKDATTVGFNERLYRILRKAGYRCELDESYLEKSIHGFLEHTTKVPLPGAAIVRRLYVGKRVSRKRLKRLQSGSNFEQGLAFGFPVCDIINYCRKHKLENKDYIAIFQDWLEQLPSSNGFKYVDFRLMGGLVKYFHPIRIIVHIPHQNDCPASLELAERNLAILGQLDPLFKNFLLAEFKKPLLIYGNSWDELGMLQLAEFKKVNTHLYTAHCSNSLPKIAAAGASLKIKLIPHKRVEVYWRNKRILQQESHKTLKWSYCFVTPYDSKEKERLEIKGKSNETIKGQ